MNETISRIGRGTRPAPLLRRTLLAVLFLSIHAAAQDDLAERMRALEKSLEAERERNDRQARRIEDLELTLSSVLAAQEESEKDAGRIDAVEELVRRIEAEDGGGARALSRGPDSPFSVHGQFRTVGRSFGGQDLSTDKSIEIEHLVLYLDAALSQDFRFRLTPGSSHTGAFFVLEAYGAYRVDDWLEISAGRFLVPFTGIHSWAFPSDTFIEPFLPENSPRPFLYSPYWDEGVLASGQFDFGGAEEHRFWYALYVINGFDADGLGGIHKRNIGDNNENKTLGGRASVTLRLGEDAQLVIGAAAATGKYDAFDKLDFYAVEMDFELAIGPFSLYAEALYRPIEITAPVAENPAVILQDVAYQRSFKLRPSVRLGGGFTLFMQLDHLEVRQPPRTLGKFSVLSPGNEAFAVQTAEIGLKYEVNANLRLVLEGGIFDRDSDLGPDITFIALSSLITF